MEAVTSWMSVLDAINTFDEVSLTLYPRHVCWGGWMRNSTLLLMLPLPVYFLTPPSHALWVKAFNDILLHEKLVNQHREGPGKMTKLWAN